MIRSLICSIVLSTSLAAHAASFADFSCGFLAGLFKGKRSETELAQDLAAAKAGLEKLIEPLDEAIEYDVANNVRYEPLAIEDGLAAAQGIRGEDVPRSQINAIIYRQFQVIPNNKGLPTRISSEPIKVDGQKLIWILTEDYRLLVSKFDPEGPNANQLGQPFKHTSFLAGERVRAAGTWIPGAGKEQGKIILTEDTGHYGANQSQGTVFSVVKLLEASGFAQGMFIARPFNK